MRVRLVFVVGVVAAVLQTFAAPQPAPQLPPERPVGKGIIEVRVTREGTTEGIPDVTVTLQGPVVAVADQVGQVFTPDSRLTAAQRQQVDQYLQQTFAINGPAEVIANTASRLQAQLLGLPEPARLSVPPPPADLTLVTDADGHVSFPGLPPGRYAIRAQRVGYYGNRPPGAAEFPTSLSGTVTVKDGDDAPATLALAMMRAVVFAGRVRDPEGQPAAGIYVSALQVAYLAGRTVLNSIKEVQTDDRGAYRMFWLPPGDYYVAAIPRAPGTAPSRQDTWARTYYPGVADARNAVPVAAPEGGEFNGIDFAIQAEATRRVGGRIVNPFKDGDGKPTNPFPSLTLIPQGSNGVGISPPVRSVQNVAPDRSNGKFEIRGIPPGVYDLVASAPTGTAKLSGPPPILNGGTVVGTFLAAPTATAWGRVRVDVGKEDLTDVTVAIKAGIEVRIRVAMDGAPPPFGMAPRPQSPDAAVINALVGRGASSADAAAAALSVANAEQVPTPRVRLSLQPKDYVPLDLSETSRASFDPSGLYVFPSVPPGLYRVTAQLLAPENYVADIRLGGASIYDDGLLVDDSLPGDVEVAIVSKGSQIQGAVANVENRPSANATVALIPAEPRRQNPELYNTVRTDAMGNFTLRGVAPGIYKLFAWENAPNGAWRSADFLSRYEQLGEAVTVMGGESLNVSLRLIPKNYGR